jgi:hypothetical protein
VTALAVSPDGTRVASAAVENTENYTVRIWDVESGRPPQVLAQPGRVDALVFSPDGRHLAGGVDTSVVVWDAETGSVLFKAAGHQRQIDVLAFSPNGQRLASASSIPWASLSDGERSVRLWDATSGKSAGVLSAPDGPVLSLAFDLTGSRVVSGHIGGTAQVWDATTNQPLLKFAVTDGSLKCLRFSPDGIRLLAASSRFAFVLDSRSPYDPDVERIVSDLFTGLPSSAEVRSRLRADRSLDAAVRQAALALVERRGDDPKRLNTESWRIAKSPGGRPEDYTRAVAYARTSTRLVPFQRSYVNTLGAALYRTAQYDECLTVLQRELLLTDEPGISNLAFTAMAHHRLGAHDKAAAALEQLRKAAANRSADRDVAARLAEVEALLQGKPSAQAPARK